MNLKVFVWNIFFNLYYGSNQDLKDTFVCKLLFNHMIDNGSRCVPDINTFNIVLSGISSSTQIQDSEHLSHLILELMDYYKILPSAQSHQHRFKIFVKTNNMLSISKLLLLHPQINFNAADINVFNRILAESPVISQFLDYPMSKYPSALIRFMLMQSMPKHQALLDIDSYQILKRLVASYPEWKLEDLLKSVPVRGRTIKRGIPRRHKNNVIRTQPIIIGDVYRVIQRLKQQDIARKWTIGYHNYLKVTPPELIGVGGRPITPDATHDLTKRDWEILMSCWRKQLHQYDNVTTDPFLHTESIQKMRAILDERNERLCSRRRDTKALFSDAAIEI